MISVIDAARINACTEEAERAMGALLEQLDAIMTDDDVTNPTYAQMKGAQLKARAANKELGKAREFTDMAFRVAKGGGGR